MTTIITRKDRVFFRAHQFINAYQGGLLTLVSGFLLGRITNEMSLPNIGFWDVVVGTFSLANRPANLLSWCSVVLLVAIPVSHGFLSRYHVRRRYDKLFALLVQKHRGRVISPYNALAWDDALSLQTCPELNRGWLMSEVKLNHNTTKFSIPEKYKQAYLEYSERYYHEKRFFDDGAKFMTTRNPVSFSDSPTLSLDTQETSYSQVQFYRDNVAILTSERDALIRSAVEGTILFPHSLCIHAIVTTSDDRVLITKRSPKVAYYPETWSCSIEEQLAPQDFQDGPDSTVVRWGRRLLLEELGLNEDACNLDNMRILSVFLESDILNVSLCGHLVVNISSFELDRLLLVTPRTDYEFNEWGFLTYDELLSELFRPTRAYHATSGYRMLMALIRRYGEPAIADRISKTI